MIYEITDHPELWHGPDMTWWLANDDYTRRVMGGCRYTTMSSMQRLVDQGHIRRRPASRDLLAKLSEVNLLWLKGADT